MGRRLRSDGDDGWHHVMNRGAGRRRIFHTAADGQRFLELIGESHEIHHVQVHAYCLMPNHFHLLVHCLDGGLSKFMQRLAGPYTRHVNWRMATDGPILRGRFHSIVVDSPEYLATVGRYIHRNPLDLSPAVDIAHYRWSSMRYYATGAVSPGWLRTAELLEPFGDRGAYHRFVDETSCGEPSVEIVSWAIDVALHELADDDVVDQAQLCRTIAASMLQVAPHHVAAALERYLDFPNAAAQRAALYRARSRSANDPRLEALSARALRLAA